MSEKHLCETCTNEFATCDAKNILWGIDRNPSARGADADKVLECDAYVLRVDGTTSETLGIVFDPDKEE